MRVYIYILIIAGVVTVGMNSVYPKDPVPIRTPIPIATPSPSASPTPSPFSIPTPAGDDGEEWLNYIQSFPDMESWAETNYDPIECCRGPTVNIKDIIFQSVTANAAVICTFGYDNIYYDDGSGDIRGLNCRGFVNIEGTAVAYRFRLMDLFVPQVYAASDKWKKVKTIKKLTKLQTKKKPKKVKWKKDKGLKEKKEKYDNE